MNANSKPLRVVFFGDSICVGQGVSIHSGWVTRISSRLAELSERIGREIVIINASVNGNTTRQALERMPYDVQSHSVDVLIVQFGMNDCNIWQTDHGNPRVSPKAFAANLEEIIDRGITFGALAVLLHTNHPSGRDRKQMPFSKVTYEQQNRKYNEIIRAVARRKSERVKLIDIEEYFRQHISAMSKPLGSLLLDDLLHLSVRGHDIYYRSVLPRLEQAVMTLVRKGVSVNKSARESNEAAGERRR